MLTTSRRLQRLGWYTGRDRVHAAGRDPPAEISRERAQEEQKERTAVPYEHILVEREERIAVVTLNRPAKLNALHWAVIGQVADTLDELDADPVIGCVVLTGGGERAFAAGADIDEMSDRSPVDMPGTGFAGWDRIRRVRTPLTAAISTSRRAGATSWRCTLT
jgi:hypothetical protein